MRRGHLRVEMWVKTELSENAVFEDDKVEGVSNRVRMEGITGVKGDGDVKEFRG